MQKNLLLLSFLAFFSPSLLFSQAKLNVDSLTAVVNAYPKEDTVKAKMLIALSDALLKKNAKDGIAYSERALIIVEKLNNTALKADALYIKARHLEISSKYTEALDLSKKSLEIYEQLRRRKKLTEVYNLLGRIYYDKNDEVNTPKYYELALSLSEQIGDLKNKTIALIGLGSLYSALEDPKKAVSYYERALTVVQRSHDRELESLALCNIAINFLSQGNFLEAIEYSQRSLRIDESLGDTNGMIYNYLDLGASYLKLQEYEKALAYFKKALPLTVQISSKEEEAGVFEKMGACYLSMKMNKEAALNIEKSIAINKAIGNTQKANSNLLTLGGIYGDSQRMIDAHRCFQEVLDTSRKRNNNQVMAAALMNLVTIYVNEPDSILVKIGINPAERHTKALALATEALAISTKINSLSRMSNALEMLSIVHEKNKDYTKAYDYYKRYITLKDSISGDEVKKQITRKEIQYEFDKKEAELKYQQQLTAGELEKQRLLTAQQAQTLTLNRQTLTLKEQALALSNKAKDLAHLAFLKEQAEKQEKSKELSLSQEREKGKALDLKLKSSELDKSNLELSAQQKQNFYLIALAVLLLAGLGAMAYFYTLLKKKNTIIAQQNELNEQTIAILSHDIKSPLMGVKLLLKKLNKDDPFVAQASQSLEQQINSVNGILTNLLKMKKVSLGKKDKNATANVNNVVKNVIQELNIAIQTKNLTIQNDLTDNLILPIAPEKLQIIVHNLLSNAIKYSFPDQTIRIFREGNGFSIQDFGIGLSPEQRTKLMREVTTSERGTLQERGNGLGLFLVGAMLQGEQLKVIFDSPDKGGTIVKILA